MDKDTYVITYSIKKEKNKTETRDGSEGLMVSLRALEKECGENGCHREFQEMSQNKKYEVLCSAQHQKL